MQTSIEREENLTIEDFKVGGKKHASTDYEFHRWLTANFEYCRDAYQQRNQEAKRLWEVFENVRTIGALETVRQVANGDISFSSAMTATKIWILICIISEQMQRIYIDPVFREDAEQRVATLMQIGVIPEWMNNAIQEETFDGFWNNTLDRITDYWWETHSLYTKTLITKQWGLVQSEAWAKLRIEDDDIIYENVPLECVFDDPDAQTPEQRRYLWQIKPMSTRDIEIEYNLTRGSVVADGLISGLKDGYSWRDMKSDNAKYRSPQCYVIEGYIKDKRRDKDGKKIFPHGRVVTFICGQPTGDTGVLVLDDYGYEFDNWPLFKFIPHPATEMRGLSVSANIQAIEMIADQILNIGITNVRECGIAKMIYKRDSIENPNLFSKNSEKIPVDDVRSIQYLQAQGVSVEAINLFSLLSRVGDDVSSIHEASSGRRPTGIESGKAIMALDQSSVRAANPYIENFKTFLMPLAHLFGQMLLATVHAGDTVRYGENFRTSYKMPISLYSVIEDTKGFIGQDNEIPMDKNAQFNFLMTIADRLPIETLLEFAPIDNKAKIIRSAGELEKAKQMIEQMQQQIQQMQQQMQSAGMEMHKKDMAIQDMQTSSKAGIIKNEYDLVKQDKQLASTHIREHERQHGKLQDTKLRGDYQLATTALQARVNKPAGSQSKSGSPNGGSRN